MPDLSSVNSGSLSLAAGFTSHSLYFMSRLYICVDFSSKGPDVFGRTAAASADDVGAGLEQRRYANSHLFRSLIVDHFHIDQFRLAGVGLDHYGQAGDALVAL